MIAPPLALTLALVIRLAAETTALPGGGSVLDWVETGGLIGALVGGLWAFFTDRIVSGKTFERVLLERNESLERERDLHRVIEEKYVPLAVNLAELAAADRRPPRGDSDTDTPTGRT